MASRGWTCRKCSHLNERRNVKCRGEGCTGRRPKKPQPAHRRSLREMRYPEWVKLNELIHGAGEDCGVCGRVSSPERHHDRDHDHDTGQPRGLACGGDFGCNRMMPRGLTASKAEWLAKALRVELVPLSVLAPYLPRDLDVNHMELIAAYLRRVELHYHSAAVSA